MVSLFASRWIRLLLALQLASFAVLAQAAGTVPRVGDTPSLPAFTAFDGKKITQDKLRGKFLVLSYFSVTCPFCMHEAPELQRLYRNNADKVTVIAINVDYLDPEQRQKTAEWIKKYKLTFPVTTDYKLIEASLGKIKGLPVNYVFDRKGKIVRIDVGEIFAEDFDDIAKMARPD